MESTIEVYSWGNFVTFIHKSCEIEPDIGSHPILDQVATDLLSGKLQRRNSKGHPIAPWQSTDELRESYLMPTEVNELPIMKSWRINWVGGVDAQVHTESPSNHEPEGSDQEEVAHSTSPKRRDKISPAIESAQQVVKDPNDVASVWNEMSTAAKNKVSPFLGIAPEGLIHESRDGKTRFFTQDALRKRLRRLH